jgi:hypothetical protein
MNTGADMAASTIERTQRSRQIVVQHSVGLPAWYWHLLTQRAEDEADTVTRLIRLAIEEKYPEIKQAKEIGQ